MTVVLLPLPSAEASNVGNTLIVGIQSSKTTRFNPLDPVERDMLSVYNLMFESLVVIDDDYMPQPGLAESWEMSSNGATWTFHLRKNLMFADGETKLTAHDVVASAQAILDRANSDAGDKGFYFNLKYFIKSISASDDHTVVVNAARKYWGLLYAMTFPVVPASQVTADRPLSSGPYYLSSYVPASTTEGAQFRLSANPYWWKAQPQVKDIVFECSFTAANVLSDFEYARVDAIFTRATAASQYKSSTTTFALDSRTRTLETLLINHSSFPFDDINIRKAVRYLVDPDKLASTVYFGMVSRTDTPAPSGTWMYNESIASYFETNREKAIALLEEAGWTDTDGDGVRDKPKADGSGSHRLHIRIFVYEEPDNDVRVEAANLIADALNSVGFECVVTAMSLTEMSEKLSKGSFDLALAAYSMDVCPDYGFFMIKGNAENVCRYKSTTMTDLCKELRVQTTQQGYKQVLDKIQLQFAEDCPFICLYYRDGAVLTRKMYTTARDVREYELLRGIESFHD